MATSEWEHRALGVVKRAQARLAAMTQPKLDALNPAAPAPSKEPVARTNKRIDLSAAYDLLNRASDRMAIVDQHTQDCEAYVDELAEMARAKVAEANKLVAELRDQLAASEERARDALDQLREARLHNDFAEARAMLAEEKLLELHEAVSSKLFDLADGFDFPP